MRPRFRSTGAIIVVAVASLAMVMGHGTAASAEPDFPTWDEVQAARNDQAAAKAQVAEIERLLGSLEAEQARLGRDAQLAGEQYNLAREALAAASVKADKLERQADAANRRAKESGRRAGVLVAQLVRTGGGDVTLGLLTSTDPGRLLDHLGTMDRLGDQASQLYSEALADRNAAESLEDQSRVAEKKRTALAAEAEAALADAEAAATEAQELVTQQQAAADELYEQLAVLNGTTAETERRYREGLTWGNDPDEEGTPGTPAPPVTPPAPGPSPTPSSPPAPNPAPTTPPVTPPAPVPPPTPPPAPQPPAAPPPSASKVEGAIAFAKAQIGDMYQFGGSGPDRWDCSGLTKAAYASVGVYIGAHGATSQYNTMSSAGRLVPLSQMVAGDLLWYSTGGSTTASKYHVTIYLGNGQMIEAPYEGQPVRIKPVRTFDLVPYAGRPTP